MATQNIDIFSHEAEAYHAFRIPPPDILLPTAQSILGTDSLDRVVDLGCGTGLSTQIWPEIARQVIGLEPNPKMRQVADAFFAEQGLDLRVSLDDGLGHATGLDDASVDLVTCSQSLHWMDPEQTHPEITRILRPGGALLAYGYTMPPTIRPAIEQAYNTVLNTAQTLIRQRALWPRLEIWSFPDQLQAMGATSWYRYIKEAFFHQILEGTADWFVGLAANYGAVARALAKGVTPEELGLAQLRQTAEQLLGGDSHRFIFHYKAIVAVK